MVDWHVSYPNTDGFGYSDAVGCPFFSSAAVGAIEKPRMEDILENGQLNDRGRNNQAYVYITRQHDDLDEGEADLITIGPCCNTDYRQGPEKFIEPKAEPIGNGGPLVLWYVVQIQNDDRDGNQYCWAESELKDGACITKVYPCYSDALFLPIK